MTEYILSIYSTLCISVSRYFNILIVERVIAQYGLNKAQVSFVSAPVDFTNDGPKEIDNPINLGPGPGPTRDKNGSDVTCFWSVAE